MKSTVIRISRQTSLKMLFKQKCRSISLMFFAALFTTLCSGCSLLPQEEEVLAPPIKEPEKVQYDTLEVKLGSIVNEVRCTGTFVSVKQQDAFFKDRGGRLKAVYMKIGDKVKKGDLIAELEADNLAVDLELQRINLKKAQLAYEKLKLQSETEMGGKYDLELASLEIEANRIRLNSLLQEQERCKLTAPIDGDIVYLGEEMQPGASINPYQIVVRIADPKNLLLKYTEDKVEDFSTGAVVDVTLSNETFRGKVIATPSDMPKDAGESLKGAVLVQLDQLPAGAEPGGTADIRLMLEKKHNVIVLPKQVINSFGGRRFVNVLKDGVREERDLELGIQTVTEAEVVKGLEVGEQIIRR